MNGNMTAHFSALHTQMQPYGFMPFSAHRCSSASENTTFEIEQQRRHLTASCRFQIVHRFPFPGRFMPGGKRIALCTAALPFAFPSPPSDPFPCLPFVEFWVRASSTFPFARPNPGVTHPPQLHRNPCHANLPMLAPHHCVGQVSRPSSSPCAKTGLIHDSGCRKMCAHGSSPCFADGSR